ncbi:energy transducer TonB, partial [Pseudomonas syringae]
MSEIVQSSIGCLSHSGDISVRNSRTLGGVTQLWSDAFARAMADQVSESATVPVHPTAVEVDVETGEPVAGDKTLSKIVEQRTCPATDTEVKPPAPLLRRPAELDLALMPPPAAPFSLAGLIEQQRHREFASHWVPPTGTHPSA